MNSDFNPDVLALVSRWLDDDEVSGIDITTLGQVVDDSRDAQVAYVDWIILDELLRGAFLDFEGVQQELSAEFYSATAASFGADVARLPEELNLPVAEGASGSCRKPPIPALGFVRTLSAFMTRSSTVSALMLAVVLYGAFGLLVWQMSRQRVTSNSDRSSFADRSTSETVGVATMTSGTDCRWDASMEPIRDGEPLKPRRLSLTSGVAHLTFNDGARVLLEGPCQFDLRTAGSGFLKAGRLVAHVPPSAVGFTVATAAAEIIDLGTEFAVEVDEEQNAEVHVFTGAVVTRAAIAPRVRDEGVRVTAGSAVRLARQHEQPIRIPLNRPRYQQLIGQGTSQALIASVATSTQKSYQIVPRGFVDGAIAYVDREAHRWYSVDTNGLPKELLGAHYVRTSNHDKAVSDLEIKITISHPADLYVLFDQRLEVPIWLSRNFTATGKAIGMCVDAGLNVPESRSRIFTCSIWKRTVPPGEYMLGMNGSNRQGKAHLTAMYGIAVVPTIDRP